MKPRSLCLLGLMAMAVTLAGMAPQAAFAKQAPGQILMKFKPTCSISERSEILESIKLMGGKVTQEYALVPGLQLVNLPLELSVDAAISKIQKLRGVEYAHPNYLRSPMLLNAPKREGDEPSAEAPPIPAPVAQPVEWVTDPKETSNFGVQQNSTNQVWRQHKWIGDSKTVIAVIDTGVDYTHPDLLANMWRNPGESGTDAEGKAKETNGIDDDGNGYVDDVVGYDFANKDPLPYDDHDHGTHVAGISAAVGGNGMGIAGHCPRCSIMALKFIRADGWGTDADAISALEYAVKMKAQVINSSWGGKEAAPALEDAFRATAAAGAFNAIAAGNDGEDLTFERHFPASYRDMPGKIAVAALYATNVMIPWWSNYGFWDVPLSCGGADVYSTVRGGKYASFSGTSMASPGIAGSAALIMSKRPDLTADQVVKMFKPHIYPDRDSMEKTGYGGRPNMKSLFKNL